MTKKTGIVFNHRSKYRKLVDIEWGKDNSFYFMPCTADAKIEERIKSERDSEGRLVLSVGEVQTGCFPTTKISRHPSGYFHIKDTAGRGGRREKDGLIGPAFKDIDGFFVFLVACPQAIETLVETPIPDPTDVIVNLPEGIEPFTVQFALWDKTKNITIPVQTGQVLGNGAVTLEIANLNFGLVIMLFAVGKSAPETVVRWPARTCYIVMEAFAGKAQQGAVQMDKDIIDTPLIDPNIDSYKQFFDHKWAERMFKVVETSPLNDAVCTLLVAWRSTNGSHLLPWLMVHSLKRFAEGEGDGSLRFRANYSGEVVKGLVGKLESKMQPSLKLDQRMALKRVVARIEEEAHDALKTAQSQVEFPLAGYWDFLTHSSEFQFSILGTQRINYGSLFFAYEDFLANVIRTKEPTYTSKKKPIKEAFPTHFGDSLADFCWNHDEVNLALLVRNALAHNGGRYGAELEKYEARFVDATGATNPKLQDDLLILVDGKIQITPGNTRYLFGVLKERVTKIVEEIA